MTTLKPFKVEFYVYAEDEKEAMALNKALYDLVDDKRKQGIAVTAKCLTKALKSFGNNIFLTNYLRNNS
jgi:hypothetical protein